MAYESLSLSELIPATEEEIYFAWLSSDQHSAFTGDEASIDPVIGGKHSTYGGYAQGAIVDLQPSRRIVQTWRTSDFPEGSPDSRLELTLEPTVGGTMLTVLHTEIPEGQSDNYREGWVKYYFDPLKKYFAEKSSDDTESLDGLAAAPANGISSHSSGPAKLTARAKKAPAPKPTAAKETAKIQAKAKAKAIVKAKAKTKPKPKAKPKAKAKAKGKPKAKLAAKSAKKPAAKRKTPTRAATKKATRGRAGKSPARSKKKKR
jgi:uncharacterized protein YndB with AHSA1/START domain